VILAGLLYFTKKKVWHDVHARGEAPQSPKAT
jgi:hypothetical protein